MSDDSPKITLRRTTVSYRRAWLWRLRSCYLIPALRLRSRVVQIERGPARLYCVSCSEHELRHVGALNARLLREVADVCAKHVGNPPRAIRVRILCLGSELNYERLPSGLPAIVRKTKEAAWWPTLRAVVVNLPATGGSSERLLVCVVHELSHALLTLLARPYVYPRALHEGFATAMESRFAHAGASNGSLNRSVLGAYHRDDVTDGRLQLGVRDLLLRDSDIPEDGTFHRASLALILFLSHTSDVRGRALDNYFTEIRRRRLSGLELYAWLQHRLGLSSDELELAFDRFRRGGTAPQVSDGKHGDA